MEILKTIVHLTNLQGWYKVIEHLGDCDYEGVYMERRVPDMTKPFGELIPDDRKYFLVGDFIVERVRYSYYMEDV